MLPEAFLSLGNEQAVDDLGYILKEQKIEFAWPTLWQRRGLSVGSLLILSVSGDLIWAVHYRGWEPTLA